MKASTISFLFFVCLAAVQQSDAQQLTCVETLNQARQSFADGRLYGIPALLKSCLDNGFNKTERIQAYWILTRTYLFIDDPISAEESYLKLLRLDPEFEVDEESDPIEMAYLSKKFTTTPIFVLFGKVGFNSTRPEVIQNFGADNTIFSNESYTGEFSYQVGFGVEMNISNHWSLAMETDLVGRRYTYQNTIFQFDDQTFQENQLNLEVPIYVRYRMQYGKVFPFVYAGYTQHFLLNAEAEISLIDRASNNESLSEFPVTGPSEDLNDLRRSTNRSIIFGLGARYRLKYDYIFVDLRYQVGLTNIIDIDNQYANDRLLYTYGYVDDDKRLNTVSFSVGYVKPLYKPRKIQKRKFWLFKNWFQ